MNIGSVKKKVQQRRTLGVLLVLVICLFCSVQSAQAETLTKYEKLYRMTPCVRSFPYLMTSQDKNMEGVEFTAEPSDTTELWKALYTFALCNQSERDIQIKWKYNCLYYTFDEITEVCYALFPGFDESLLDFYGLDGSHGAEVATMENGEDVIHFKLFTPEVILTKLVDAVENGDGSLDVTYLIGFYSFYESGSLYRFHMIPNANANRLEDPFYYYTITQAKYTKLTEEEREAYLAEEDGYIFEDSDTRDLTDADVEGMDAETLMYVRNEIYARRARCFQNLSLQVYFGRKSWYKGAIAPDEFDPNGLNEHEMKNIEFLLQKENVFG